MVKMQIMCIFVSLLLNTNKLFTKFACFEKG
jgi:hypothetical protein